MAPASVPSWTWAWMGAPISAATAPPPLEPARIPGAQYGRRRRGVETCATNLRTIPSRSCSGLPRAKVPQAGVNPKVFEKPRFRTFPAQGHQGGVWAVSSCTGGFRTFPAQGHQGGAGALGDPHPRFRTFPAQGHQGRGAMQSLDLRQILWFNRVCYRPSPACLPPDKTCYVSMPLFARSPCRAVLARVSRARCLAFDTTRPVAVPVAMRPFRRLCAPVFCEVRRGAPWPLARSRRRPVFGGRRMHPRAQQRPCLPPQASPAKKLQRARRPLTGTAGQ